MEGIRHQRRGRPASVRSRYEPTGGGVIAGADSKAEPRAASVPEPEDSGADDSMEKVDE